MKKKKLFGLFERKSSNFFVSNDEKKLTEVEHKMDIFFKYRQMGCFDVILFILRIFHFLEVEFGSSWLN